MTYRIASQTWITAYEEGPVTILKGKTFKTFNGAANAAVTLELNAEAEGIFTRFWPVSEAYAISIAA